MTEIQPCSLIFFGIQYIPQEELNKIEDKSIALNISRIQSVDSIMCKFYCIPFIEYIIGYMILLIRKS